jgi:carbamoyl-phosphate synthase large subunit
LADSRSLRRAALVNKVPYYTTLAGAAAAASGIAAMKSGVNVYSLQEYIARSS